MLITRLAILDFDGTLIDTELPITGKVVWQERTGREWPHIGWWGKSDSLSMKVFDNKPFSNVVTAYKKERAKDNTLVVMLTGRIQELSKYVRAILDHHDLTFDKYLYNCGGHTFENKIMQISELLASNSDINEVVMFDDKHIQQFQEFGDKLITDGVIRKFHITQVVKGQFVTNQ